MDTTRGVIVGVDGSPDAAAALRWAVDHGARHHLPVTAIASCVEHRHRALAGGGGAGQDRRSDPAFDLDLTITTVLGPSHDVRAVVTTTPAAEALEEASDDADLVVVGAGHLDHAVRRLLTHSVAEDVARHTGCPVAIVREWPAGPDDPVVVGVDGSAASRRALQWAVDDCTTSGRSIIAVHAWHVDVATFGIVITDDDVMRMERAAGEVLDDVIGSLERNPGPVGIEGRTVYATATGAILHAVPDAAMLVVGSRRLGSMKRLLLGSTSELVARDASGVVVIVPPAPSA